MFCMRWWNWAKIKRPSRKNYLQSATLHIWLYLDVKGRYLDTEKLLAYWAIPRAFLSIWPQLVLKRAGDSPDCKWKFSWRGIRAIDHGINLQESYHCAILAYNYSHWIWWMQLYFPVLSLPFKFHAVDGCSIALIRFHCAVSSTKGSHVNRRLLST